MPSIIGTELSIEGNLKSAGDIEVQGTVKGDIEGKSVTVEREAQVSGSIHAESLTISGAVDGQIEASSVTLTSTAKVTGDLLHRTLAVEAGASVEAQFRQMSQDRKAPEARPVRREGSAEAPRQPSSASSPAAAPSTAPGAAPSAASEAGDSAIRLRAAGGSAASA